jgi:hypothetical protein
MPLEKKLEIDCKLTLPSKFDVVKNFLTSIIVKLTFTGPFHSTK